MGRTPPGSALLVDVNVLGVDHLVARTLLRARPAAARRTGTPGTSRRPATFAARAAALAVHHLGQLVRGLGELLGGVLHGARVVALQGLPGLGERLLELPLLGGAELLLVLVVGL